MKTFLKYVSALPHHPCRRNLRKNIEEEITVNENHPESCYPEKFYFLKKK